MENIGALQDFLQLHKISFNNAAVGFDCEYDIVTPQHPNGIEGTAKLRITFTGFGVREGEVTIDCDLEPEKFPTNFYSGFGDINLVDDYLVITGTHKTIGAYTVTLSNA